MFYTQAPDPGAAAHVIDKNLALLEPLGVTDRAVHFPDRDPSHVRRCARQGARRRERLRDRQSRRRVAEQALAAR